ncbi:50S ribosomal protein L29 [Patescibacteria group bacterium]|nr:50S ribosomal protein L29 [Patescibacteria group bacterium]
MNIADVRKKTETELTETLREVRRECEKIVKDILQNKEKNVKKLGFLKKDIARLKTVLNERKDDIMPVVVDKKQKQNKEEKK